MMMMMIVWKLLVFKNSLKPAPKSGVESNETGDSCAKTKPDKSFTTSRCVVPPLIKFILESLQKKNQIQHSWFEYHLKGKCSLRKVVKYIFLCFVGCLFVQSNRKGWVPKEKKQKWSDWIPSGFVCIKFWFPAKVTELRIRSSIGEFHGRPLKRQPSRWSVSEARCGQKIPEFWSKWNLFLCFGLEIEKRKQKP